MYYYYSQMTVVPLQGFEPRTLRFILKWHIHYIKEDLEIHTHVHVSYPFVRILGNERHDG